MGARAFARTTCTPVNRWRASPPCWWAGLLITGATLAHGTDGFHNVFVNGVSQPGFAMLVFDPQARPYMAANDFKRLGFATTIPTVLHAGLAVVPLIGHPGMQVHIGNDPMRVLLDVAPHWYGPSRLNLRLTRTGQPLAAPFGALLNYSVQASQNQPKAMALASSQSLSIFGPQGHLQWHSTLQHEGGSPNPWGQAKPPVFRRLGTTFVRDDLEQLSTLTVGDAVLQPSTGVPAVRYGGLTWRSHFGLDPGFSTFDTPSLFDSARLPSTLEFYLDDRRVGSPLSVPAGPFEISGLPTVGVQGTIKVLIRDALQNERTVSVPYLQNASLYRPGLHSFSYTAGWLRPALERYNTPFISSAHRWGVAHWLTLNAGTALSAQRRSLGVGSTVALPAQVIANLNLATSQAQAGSGHQVTASLQWLGKQSSLGGSYLRASSGFEMLGDANEPAQRTHQDLRFYAAHALDHGLGSLSVSWGSLTLGAGLPRSIRSIGWNRSFGRANFSLSALHTGQSSMLQAVLNIPLQARTYLSTRLQKQSQQLGWRTDFSTQPATDLGLSWRLGMHTPDLAHTSAPSEWVAAVDARSSIGEHGMEWFKSPQGNAWRVHTAGSVGVLAGHRFAAPPISGGFALVSTGDAPHVPIYRWNLPVAISNAQGLAVVTTLVPYQNNLLAIQPQDVPLDYRITQHEMTAIPHGRGGVWVDFGVLRERPALVTLTQPNGQALANGSMVRVESSGEWARVGLHGQVYLQNLSEQTTLHVQHLGQTCRINLHHPPTQDPQPRLGPLICHWESP